MFGRFPHRTGPRADLPVGLPKPGKLASAMTGLLIMAYTAGLIALLAEGFGGGGGGGGAAPQPDAETLITQAPTAAGSPPAARQASADEVRPLEKML